jgi:prevent-host-death family protein
MSEIRVGVRDFKARLSEYLHQVRKDDTVIITDHGHPVGRLTPVEQALEDRIKALQEAGMVAWNGRKLGAATPAAVNRGERQVSDLLVEMRE